MIAVSDSALPVYQCQPAIDLFIKRIQQVTGAKEAVIQRLIRECGEESVVARLQTVDAFSLQKWGFTAVQAQRLIAALDLGQRVTYAYSLKRRDKVESPEEAAELIRPLIGFAPVEHFVLVSLNIRHRVLGIDTMAVGSMQECLVDPKVLLRTLISYGASACFVAHNHPSGSKEPSPEDILLTRALLKATQVVGITLLDHLVITHDSFNSIRETATEIWAGMG